MTLSKRFLNSGEKKQPYLFELNQRSFHYLDQWAESISFAPALVVIIKITFLKSVERHEVCQDSSVHDLK